MNFYDGRCLIIPFFSDFVFDDLQRYFVETSKANSKKILEDGQKTWLVQ